MDKLNCTVRRGHRYLLFFVPLSCLSHLSLSQLTTHHTVPYHGTCFCVLATYHYVFTRLSITIRLSSAHCLAIQVRYIALFRSSTVVHPSRSTPTFWARAQGCLLKAGRVMVTVFNLYAGDGSQSPQSCFESSLSLTRPRKMTIDSRRLFSQTTPPSHGEVVR